MADFKINGNDGAGAEVNIQLTAPTTATINALDTASDYEGRVEADPNAVSLRSVNPSTGKEVAVSVEGARHVYVKTENIYNSAATNGDVLTLMDKTTGKVEYQPAPTGGLTSVGVEVATAVDAIVVLNSPLTSNGTITLTSGGNGTQYVDGNLQLQTMPTGLPPTGAAGGDLAGTYPNPIVSHVHGVEMQSGAPTDGDTWVFSNTNNKWQHQQLHATQVDNDSAVTGTHVSDALNHLNTTKVQANAEIGRAHV